MSGVRVGFGKGWRSVALIVAVGLTLAGCDHARPSGPTQVVAQVDGHEITVSEVNAVLAQMPMAVSTAVPGVRHQAIHALVEQQLEMDQAKRQKLDQTPAVLLQLELARRQVLANAYLQQVAQAVPNPTHEAARQYYDAHPDLFAQRKIYQLRELDTRGDAALQAQVQADVKAGKTLDAIATALKSQGKPVQVNQQTLPAERIPLDLLPQLARLPTGEILVVRDHGIVRVIEVQGSQAQPVDETQALPVIREALLNRARKAAIAQDVERLEAQAKIHYLALAAAGAGKPADGTTHPASSPQNAINQGAAGLQ